MSNLGKHLEVLAEYRTKLEQANTTRATILATITEQVKADPVYIKAEQDAKELEVYISQIEENIRGIALTEWVNTKNKHPHEKVEVKIFKTFKVVNPDAVREFVLKNIPAALQVDSAKVKKFAMEIGPVDGTEVGEEARVQIASKL